MISYDELRSEVRRRKQERWAKILASEPSGRAPGRRPRDPEKERILLRLDRLRLARLEALRLAERRGSDGTPKAR